ncbi:S24 family peptidase [Pseudomonas sp. NBRC 111135]|uniref:S24 family peptidase n=1 Tax=Pseudomonas sp. NBRC 111135 TaxID=1661050 RepID=UPI0006D469FB|nr:LexA family transcriptional regulator [Pseudomonas sp. NBRC 111135]
MKTTRRPMEDWEKNECAALKAAFVEYNRGRKGSERLTQEEAAEFLGINQGSLSNYLNGHRPLNLTIATGMSRLMGIPVSKFSPRLARDLEKFSQSLQRHVDEYMGDVGDHQAEPSNVAPMLQPHREPRKYPLISWIAAGERAESPDIFAPGDAEEWLDSTENAGDGAYWLEVKGKSMISDGNPSFPPGMVILVKPEGVELINGKFYVFRHISGETTFKQYLYDTGTQYIAPLNPTFKTVEMDDEWAAIGRVVDAKLRGL